VRYSPRRPRGRTSYFGVAIENTQIPVAVARADGTLAGIQRRWLVDHPESVVMPDIPPATAGETLRVGTSLLVGLPFVAQADGRYIGHDMELLQTFAAWEGLRLEMVPMEFDALIASLAVGKIDMILSRLSITDERRAKVDFSVPYDHEFSAALVQRRNLAPELRGEAPLRPSPGARAFPGTVEVDRPATLGPGHPTQSGWRSLDDLARGRIAVFAGAIQDQFVVRTYPEAEVIHLTGHADLITSLKTGKVDAGIIIATSAPDILKANAEIGLLGEPLLPVSQAAAFRHQDQELRYRFDRFMAGIMADGTHAEMRGRWFEGDSHQAKMPVIPLPASGPALRLGTSVFVGLPYVGMVDGEYVGFDIELARRFAAHEELRLEISPLEFSALIPALAAGKLDLVVSALAVTPERQKQVSFSTPYAEVSSVTLALKKNLAGSGGAAAGQGAAGEGEPRPSFLAELKASFYANFVLEQRWRLVLNGLWATLLISVASTLFGTLLGALICWLRMSPRTLPRLLGSGYIFLIRGLPVLL
ncbi:MAG: transporter substrate-binding domain-containing protein, partial [Chromatiaceae bacterium]